MNIQGPEGQKLTAQDVSQLPVVPANSSTSTAPPVEEGRIDAKPEASASPPQDPVEGRPSLDVAIETHGHLARRVESLLGRLASWKTEDGKLLELVANIDRQWKELGAKLAEMKAAGYVVKSNARSRVQACITLGRPLRLRDEKRAGYIKLYTPEELDRAEIIGNDVAADLVFVSFRPNAVPAPFKLTDLEPA